MKTFKIKLNDKDIIVDCKTKFHDLIEKNTPSNKYPIVLAELNHNIHELSNTICENGEVKFIDISNSIGASAYLRTLQFILIKACYDIFKDATLTIEHSLSNGIFGEIHKDEKLTQDDIYKIKDRMKQIVEQDIVIEKVRVSREEAENIFKKFNMHDKLRLLKHLPYKELSLYKLDNVYDYFYGPMAYSTGVGKVFDLLYYEPGFILQYPSSSNPTVIKPYVEQKKLAKIFYEAEQWGKILNVGDVGALNDKVENGEIGTMVRVAEALHEKKIAYIADTISQNKKIKIVLIAGPSSSGKTTFSKRLSIQLRVNGLIPIPISLDDYFVDRENTPKDENGNYDFESIYALNLQLFNQNLQDLLAGKKVFLPRFDFKKGKSKFSETPTILPKNGILIIEGIHGLNEILTASIPSENKFKIYISALAQLNLDNHNRIATTDIRKIRRIVRDYLSRGYNAEDTLKMWPSIKRGEQRNIFVFQEEADVMFNSTLVYELCVLKKYALEELNRIKPSSPVYYEALRLKSFLKFFKNLDKSIVPENSILREFIGGSCFYKY